MDILTSIQSYFPITDLSAFQAKWNADDKTQYDKAFVDKISGRLEAINNESINPSMGLSSITDSFDDYWEQLKDSLNESAMNNDLTVENQIILNAYLHEASGGCPKAQAIKRVALYLCEEENDVQAVVESYLASSDIDMIEAGPEEGSTTTSIHEDKVIVSAYKGALSQGFSEGKEAYTVVADALDISPREVRLAVEAGNTSEGKTISNDTWTKINEAFGKKQKVYEDVTVHIRPTDSKAVIQYLTDQGLDYKKDISTKNNGYDMFSIYVEDDDNEELKNDISKLTASPMFENKFPTGGNSDNVQRFKEILSGAGASNDYSASVLTNMYGMYKGSLDESVVSALGPVVEKWSSKTISSKEVFDHFHKVFNEAKINEAREIPADDIVKINAFIENEIANGIFDKFDRDGTYADDEYSEAVLGMALFNYGYTFDDYRLKPFDLNGKINESLERIPRGDLLDALAANRSSSTEADIVLSKLGMPSNEKGYLADHVKTVLSNIYTEEGVNNILGHLKPTTTNESVDNLTAGMTFFDSRKGLRARILSVDSDKVTWHYYDKAGTTPDMDKQESLSDDQFKYLVDNGAYQGLRAKEDDPFTQTNEKVENPKATPELIAKAEKTGKPVTYNLQKTDFCYVSLADDKFTLYNSNGDVLKTGSHKDCLDAKAKFINESIFGEPTKTPIPQDTLDKIVADITNLNFTNGTMDDPNIQAEVLAKYGFDKDDYLSALNTYVYEQKVYEFVRKSGSKWKVYSHKGKTLGTHDTKEEANAQLRAIEANKHANEIKMYEAISSPKRSRIKSIKETAYNEPKVFMGADSVKETVETKVSKEDLERVRDTMVRYNRTSGYMDMVDGKLTFFDGNPALNGVGAAYVTMDDINTWIADYGKEDVNEMKMVVRIKEGFENVDSIETLVDKVKSICPDYTEKTSTPNLTTYHDKNNRLIGQWHNTDNKGLVLTEMIGDPDYFYDESASANSVNGYEFMPPYGYNDMPIIEDGTEEDAEEYMARRREGLQKMNMMRASLANQLYQKAFLDLSDEEKADVVAQVNVKMNSKIGESIIHESTDIIKKIESVDKQLMDYGMSDTDHTELMTKLGLEKSGEYMDDRLAKLDDSKLNSILSGLEDALKKFTYKPTDKPKDKTGREIKVGDNVIADEAYLSSGLIGKIDKYDWYGGEKGQWYASMEFAGGMSSHNVPMNSMTVVSQKNPLSKWGCKPDNIIGINEDANVAINSEYKFFVVNKDTKKIVWGSEYKEDAQDYKTELGEGNYAVYGTSYIKSTMSIDPFDSSNWANK